MKTFLSVQHIRLCAIGKMLSWLCRGSSLIAHLGLVWNVVKQPDESHYQFEERAMRTPFFSEVQRVLRDEYYQITFEMCEPRKELAVRRLEEIARRIQKPEVLTKTAELRKLLIRQFVAVNHLED